MNKTGSVYVNNRLKSLNRDYYFKHHEIPSDKIIASNRIKFGTIRDPFSWYVSLWSYGCLKNKKSGVYNNLTRSKFFKSIGNVDNKIKAITKKNLAFINLNLMYNTKTLYSDVTNPVLFRKWLKIILSDEFSPVVNYPMYHSNLYKYGGLFTARMIKFYFNNHKLNECKINLDKGLRFFLDHNCYIDDFLETNNLDSNLSAFFEKYNFHLGSKNREVIKKNVSSVNINHYCTETYNLVMNKEQILINYMNERHNINLITKYPYLNKG